MLQKFDALRHRATEKSDFSDSVSTTKASEILSIAKSQIGIREATGNNDGLAVEKYLHYTGNNKGEPWCASFVSWVFGQAGYKQPQTAWSPALFPSIRQVPRAAPAMVFGIYFPKLKRIGHVGLVEKVSSNWIYTIEGNTNPLGSREGDGVYKRIRHTRTIAQYADWLKEKGVKP
ncbi:MAG: CHAP domain-containing protein [Chitinophagaceae bacterium]|nr:MAG: CHAP domain-containing protein [Chitinophagaceae bacterium]